MNLQENEPVEEVKAAENGFEAASTEKKKKKKRSTEDGGEKKSKKKKKKKRGDSEKENKVSIREGSE